MTLKDLHKLALARQRIKYPNMPEAALYVKPFKASKANELTRSIETFIKLTGHVADRINNGAVYDKAKGVYRSGSVRKGIADIMATKRIEHQGRVFGVTVAIEVKIGRDRQSEHQKAFQAEIERGGGVYIIARDWDGFYRDWEAIK